MEPATQQQALIDSDPAFKSVIGQTKHRITDDRTLLQAVIDFANDETDLEPVKDSWRHQLAMDIGLFPPVEQPPSARRKYEREVKKKISESEIDKAVTRDQQRAKNVLTEAIQNLAALKTRLQRYAANSEGRLGIVRTPVLIQRENDIRIEWTLREGESGWSGLINILSYASALLITDEDHVRRDLCRCNLDTCSKFFFAKKSKSGVGKPRTRYCCDEHMRQAHEMDNARRQRVSKARKRQVALQRQRRGRGK